MERAMSKTAAIKMARQYGRIWGGGTSWTVIGPYRDDDPNGPYTELHRQDFVTARRDLTTWRASIALYAMLPDYDPENGYTIAEVLDDVMDCISPATLSSVVAVALRRLGA